MENDCLVNTLGTCISVRITYKEVFERFNYLFLPLLQNIIHVTSVFHKRKKIRCIVINCHLESASIVQQNLLPISAIIKLKPKCHLFPACYQNTVIK